MKCPCIDCVPPKRHIEPDNCHTSCQGYKEWKEEVSETKQEELKRRIGCSIERERKAAAAQAIKRKANAGTIIHLNRKSWYD